MTNKEYHAKNMVGKSGLDLIARSPAHYWAKYINPDRIWKPDTPSQVFGTLVHTAILEPEKIASTYAVVPADMNKHTNAWKDFKKEYAHKKIVDADDMQAAMDICASVMKHPQAGALLSAAGVSEKAIFATDPETGVEVKIKPDRFTDAGIIIDLKTTDDARRDAFAKSVYKYRYHVQDAFYTDVATWAGRAVQAFVFIAIEKEPPYAVSVWWLDAEAREKGRAAYRADLDVYAQCLKEGAWHSYQQPQDEDIILSLPKWAQ